MIDWSKASLEELEEIRELADQFVMRYTFTAIKIKEQIDAELSKR